MKIKNLSLALACASLPISGTFAAALDRSGQSIAAFLQPGNYAEAGLSILDPNVSGYDTRGASAADMASDYAFAQAAFKVQATENISFGLLYDQPFGASAKYSGQNSFTTSGNDSVLGTLPVFINDKPAQAPMGVGLETGVSGSTSVEVDTHSLSAIIGFQPTENINLYGGAVYQTVEGHVKLRGSAYSLFNGYNAEIDRDGEFGWLIGAAYQIPEIALKASITYRSEIKHEMDVTEQIPVAAALADPMKQPALIGLIQGLTAAGHIPPAQAQGLQGALGALGQGFKPGNTAVTTPQSVNLDLQSGIMENTIAFVNVRWVDWSNFAIKPNDFGQLANAVGAAGLVAGKANGFNLVDYSKDQWSVTTGVGRKINDKWAGNISVGWDSGAGNPVTTLGPTDGFWNVGLGAQYSPTEQYFVAGGVKYFWLGDADAMTGAHSTAGKFENNDAIAYGLKLGYRF